MRRSPEVLFNKKILAIREECGNDRRAKRCGLHGIAGFEILARCQTARKRRIGGAKLGTPFKNPTEGEEELKAIIDKVLPELKEIAQ